MWRRIDVRFPRRLAITQHCQMLTASKQRLIRRRNLAQNPPCSPRLTVCLRTNRSTFCHHTKLCFFFIYSSLLYFAREHGVLGVECSNHSVPTIFFNDLARFGNDRALLFLGFDPFGHRWVTVSRKLVKCQQPRLLRT